MGQANTACAVQRAQPCEVSKGLWEGRNALAVDEKGLKAPEAREAIWKSVLLHQCSMCCSVHVVSMQFVRTIKVEGYG